MIVILVVRPNDLQTRLRRTVDLRDHEPRCHRDVDAGQRDTHGHQQSKCVDDDISLSPGDFLASVVSTAFARLRTWDRLGVDATGTGELISIGRVSLPNQLHNASVQSIQGAVISPTLEVVIDRTLGQQVMRKHVPLASTSSLILNRVVHFTKVNLAWLTKATHRRQSFKFWADQLPLFIRNVRLVGPSFGIHRYPLRCGENQIVRVLRRFRHQASRIVSQLAVDSKIGDICFPRGTYRISKTFTVKLESVGPTSFSATGT